MDLMKSIRNVADFPKPGIQFKDLTTLWGDPAALRFSTDALYERYKDQKIDKIVGAESRGFIVGTPLAYLLNAGFVPVRKPGKLPARQITATYELEYGTDTLAMHEDAIQPGEKVLIADDLLATGGTLKATVELVRKLKGEVAEICVLVELAFLQGRKALDVPVYSLVSYDEE
jgi:adenine phosphoribosyltransferase